MKKKGIIVVIIIILLILIGLGVYFFVIKDKDNNTNIPNNNQNNNQQEEQGGNNQQDDENNKKKTPQEVADELAISFGTYNGKDIGWQVLDVDALNERALLITKNCLEEVKFHNESNFEDLTWRTSDLRVWLIGDFYTASFTADEKAKIIEVENPLDINSETGAKEPEGYETTDTVFILSATEMLKYFKSNENMVGKFNNEPKSYWTRTPGNDTTGYVCTYADLDGGLYMTGNSANSTEVYVRPAIWVDISTEE